LRYEKSFIFDLPEEWSNGKLVQIQDIVPIEIIFEKFILASRQVDLANNTSIL
jgi:hypothetical protein